MLEPYAQPQASYEHLQKEEQIKRMRHLDYPGVLEHLSREEQERFVEGEIDPALRPVVRRLLNMFIPQGSYVAIEGAIQ